MPTCQENLDALLDHRDRARRAQLRGTTGARFLVGGNIGGEHHDDAVVVLIEQGIGGHHAIAGPYAALPVSFDTHRRHHRTDSDRRP